MSCLIAVLLITNIWIFAYRFLLYFLNQIFPIQPSSSFLIPGASPEPFEIPLYIVLTIIVILGSYFLYFRFSLRPKLSLRQKWLLLLLLGLLFASQLGNYPLSQNSGTPAYITPFMKNLALVVVAGYVLLVAATIIVTARLSLILEKRKKSPALLYLFIILAIAFFTFQPGFPISWHDYSYYLGPILEIANGKTIFTEVPSRYGFLSVLTLAGSLKLGIFQVGYFPFLIYLAYILQYFLCFYLVFKISKSATLAALSLFSIMTLNYFSLGHLPISLPQVGPTRWLPMILTLYFFYKFKKINAKILIIVVALVSLFTIDSGISLLLAYPATLFLFFLKREIALKKAVLAVLYLSASILFLLGLIYIGLLLGGYKQIGTGTLFVKLAQYSRLGFGMIEMPEFTYFWLVMLVYFASLVYYFREKKVDTALRLLVLVANISFIGAIYYVGRSHPHNLFNISLLPILNVFLLLAIFYQKLQRQMRLAVLTLGFLLLIFVPAFNRRVSLAYIGYEKINRLGIRVLEDRLPQDLIYHFCRPPNRHFIKSEMDECLTLRYGEDAEFINREIPDKEILILSPDDTYLFYLTGKKNLLYFNPQSDILTTQDLDFTLKRAIELCPKKIVVDPRILNESPKSGGTLNYVYTVQPDLFDKIQNECGLRYTESKCADNTCIVEAVTEEIK